jgi:hypothetical protein
MKRGRGIILFILLAQAIVRNALQAGEWGNEEKEGKMPFEKGVGFDLIIANESTQFSVSKEEIVFPI